MTVGRLRQQLSVPATTLAMPEWGSNERPYPRDLTVHELIERQVARRPDATAVIHGDHRVSYAGLDARANRWAELFRRNGIGPECLVGVHLERSPELIAVLLGVFKAGGAYLPLDPNHPKERVEFLADDAGLRALVTAETDLRLPDAVRLIEPGAVDAVPSAVVSSAVVSGAVAGLRAAGALPPLDAANSLAFVLSTSGSTGQPKGVAVTHANAVDLLFWSAEAFGADLDRVLAGTSICFDCHILEIFGPLAWGGAVVLAANPTDIVANLDGTWVTLIHTVPSIVDELLRTDRLPDTVRSAMIGGETLLPGLVDRVYDRSSIERLLNLYGPTECTSYATMAVVARATVDAPPIGRPVANTTIHLLDPDGRPVPLGEPGEAFIGGAGVTRGYLNRPALTAERFVPEPFSGRPGERMYRTGDLCRLDATGELWFVRRVDDQVKVHGVRVEPGEVERALLAHPGVRDAAVVGVDGDGSATVLAAFVVPLVHGTLRPDTVRSYLRGKLPRSFVPEVVEFLHRLPRTDNGKVDRRRLPGMLPAAPAAGCRPVGPLLSEEQVLAAMWAEAIGTAEVSADADVFELGAHSLTAFRVSAQLGARLGEEVGVRLAFEHPTVAGQAAELRRRFGSRLLRHQPDAGTTRQSGGTTRADGGTSHRSDGAPGAGAPSVGGRALSLTQAALLARADASPDDPSLTLPLFVRLAGPFSATALGHALAAVVDRHELLRSTIGDGQSSDSQSSDSQSSDSQSSDGQGGDGQGGDGQGGGEARFFATAAPRRPLPLVDLRGLDRVRREAVANELADAMTARRWPVREEPPLRAALLRLDAEEHVLLIVLHAMAGDSWSIETLSHQLLVHYAAAVHGGPSDAPAAIPQYHEWATAQLRRLLSPDGLAQRRYWSERLAGLPVLRVPGDAARAALPGAPVFRSFDVPTTAQRLNEAVGRAEGATPFMVLLTAFAIVVHRWTGLADFTVGCPTSGRATGDLTQLIGPCTDALVMRVDLAGDPTFREALRRVRDLALQAYSNRDVPFVALAEEFPAEPSRHPLYQASIEFHQRPSLLDADTRDRLFASVPLGDLLIYRFRELLAVTSLDLELSLYERDEDLEGVLGSRADVLRGDQVERLARDFRAAVEHGVRAPDSPISEFPSSISG